MDERNQTEIFLDLLGGTSSSPLWLPVLSGSMHPTLVTGDAVKVIPCDCTECKTGDIIVFRIGATLNAHRLVAKLSLSSRTILLQQGDGMPRGGFINPEAVVGKCVSLRRGCEEIQLTDARRNRAQAAKNRSVLFLNIIRSAMKWILRALHIIR